MKRIACALLLVWPAFVWGQKADSCAEINAAKAKTYGFQPSQLADRQRQVKSVQMDAFWRLVGQDKATGIPCLEHLLRAEKQDGFFLFDGASLLYSLDQSEASTSIVVDSLKRADMAEVEASGYLRLLLKMSNAGVDVGPLAQRYLEYPKVDTYIPQHAMDLDRDMGALLVYTSMPPEKEDAYLVAALSSKERYARATAA
ncbi:MAG TPA: hypothetical protein VJQ82_06235, partial [Terriglobales bacterium]|nr:hypothetical protein [Terriglobales bacterium]